jgi:hypothetical protein
MRDKRMGWLVLLIGFSLSAQIKGIVVDENGKAIPYVNIWLANGNLIATSEVDGGFTIETKETTPVLIFSALGYETKTFKATQIEKVVLKTVTIGLDEVVVKKTVANRQKELGYYETGGFRYHMDYFVNALFFDIPKEEREAYPFIGAITFRTLSENEKAKIRVIFVERNEDGSPSNRFLTEEAIIEVKKGNRKNVIDVSARKIEVPENGFFIVFEKLKIEENKHYKEYVYKTSKGDKKTIKGLYYQPEIPVVPVKDAVGWYKFVGDKWEKSSKTMLDKPNSYENLLMKKYHDKYLVPAVNITLTN